MGKAMGAPPDVPARLEGYAPRDVPSELWTGELRPFVLSAVLGLEPAGLATACRYARVLTRLAAWCVGEGLPLDVEVVLDPDTVERFCSIGLAGDASRGTYRADLRRIGPRLTRRAPWEPRPASLSRRQVAVPYLSEELDALCRDSRRQSTPTRRRAARVLIALGAGAGLDGRWVTRVSADDVVGDNGVAIRLTDRLVPVLAEFEDDILELAASAAGEFLVGGRSLARNRAGYLASAFEASHGNPSLSSSRLRSTWLVHHLTIGTRLPELAAAAGLVGVTVLSDLLEFVPPLPADQAARMLRGVR